MLHGLGDAMCRAWKTGLEAAGGERTNGAVVLFFGDLNGLGYEFGKAGRSGLDAGIDEKSSACGGADRGVVGRAGGREADLRGPVEEAFQVADGIAGLAEVVDQG